MEQSIPETEHPTSKAGGADSAQTDPSISESELGRLFVEAQHFTDDALAKLEGQVERVLAQAGRKAAEIVLEAREEADEILKAARQTVSVSSDRANELKAAIDELSGLVKDLGAVLKSARTPNAAGDVDAGSA